MCSSHSHKSTLHLSRRSLTTRRDWHRLSSVRATLTRRAHGSDGCAVKRVMQSDVRSLRADWLPAFVDAVAHGAGALDGRVVAVRLAHEQEANQPRATVLPLVHRTFCKMCAKTLWLSSHSQLLIVKIYSTFKLPISTRFLSEPS